MTRETLRDRLRDECVLRGDFTLASGRRSQVYFEKFRALCDPALLGGASAAMLSVSPMDAAVLAGPELGAVPLMATISLMTTLPYMIVRRRAKDHGTSQSIEGLLLMRGARCLMIEDVITSGGSAVRAIEAVRAVGFVVSHCIALLDRQEGGAAALLEVGVDLRAAFTASELGM